MSKELRRRVRKVYGVAEKNLTDPVQSGSTPPEPGIIAEQEVEGGVDWASFDVADWRAKAPGAIKPYKREIQ